MKPWLIWTFGSQLIDFWGS